MATEVKSNFGSNGMKRTIPSKHQHQITEQKKNVPSVNADNSMPAAINSSHSQSGGCVNGNGISSADEIPGTQRRFSNGETKAFLDYGTVSPPLALGRRHQQLQLGLGGSGSTTTTLQRRQQQHKMVQPQTQQQLQQQQQPQRSDSREIIGDPYGPMGGNYAVLQPQVSLFQQQQQQHQQEHQQPQTQQQQQLDDGVFHCAYHNQELM